MQSMAFDAFLYFQDTSPTFIPQGESTDPVFGQTSTFKAFQIENFGFGIKNNVTIGSGTTGGGAGKGEFEVFKFSKTVDSGSNNLFACCTTGRHIGAAVLMLRKAGGVDTSADDTKTQPCYLCFKFLFCYVDSVAWSGSTGDDVPKEDITFAYGSMQICYKKQLNDGTLDGTPRLAQWSQVQNVPELVVATGKGMVASDITVPAGAGW
jgi:type VI secretion system secreted protein Hcp